MVEIVKGSDKYTESFKMKAVNPDGVLFRFLPNITTIDQRREFVEKSMEIVLHPPKRERKKVSIAGVSQKKTEIKDALLIYMDGTLMKRVSPTRGLKEEMDYDIFSAMLTAVQNFISSTFKEQSGFKTLQHGKLTLAVERGPQMFLVVVYTGPEPANLRPKMRYSLIDIYDLNKVMVKHWDGSEESLKGIEEILSRIFEIET